MNIYTVSWGIGKEDKEGRRVIDSPMTVAVVRTEDMAFKDIEKRVVNSNHVINGERYYIDEQLLFTCETNMNEEGFYDIYTIEKWEV